MKRGDYLAGDSRTEVERKKGKERKRDANDFSRHMRQRNDEGLVGSSVNGRVADRNAIRRSRREEVRQILVEPVEREDRSTTPSSRSPFYFPSLLTTEKRFPEIPSCPPFVYLFPSRFPSLDFADFQIRETHTHSAFLIKARRFKRDVAGKPEETRLVTMVKRASLILSPLGGGGGKDGERNGCRLNTLRLECENARCVCAREGGS